MTSNLITCPKCAGAAKIHGFSHVEHGRCFRCNGSGQVEAAPPSDRVAVSVGPDGARYKILTQEQAGAFLAAGNYAVGHDCILTIKAGPGGRFELMAELSEEGEKICGGTLWFAGRPGAWRVEAISDSLRHRFTKTKAGALLDQICRA